MKITSTAPQSLAARDQDAEVLDPDAAHFYCVDTVLEEGYVRLVRLEDDGIVRELEEAIVNADALRWDGWDRQTEDAKIKVVENRRYIC